MTAEVVGLEGEDGVETVNVLAQLLHAALLPCPYLGGYVVVYAYVAALCPLGYAEVECGVVNKDYNVGAEALDVGLYVIYLTEYGAQILCHLHKAEEGHLLVVV